MDIEEFDTQQEKDNEDLPFGSDDQDDGEDKNQPDEMPEELKEDGKELEDELQEELDQQPSPELPDDLKDEIAEVEGNEKKTHQYKHFVVHEATGKVEILDKIIPGIVTYTFNPNQVTPNDLRYMIEAIEDGAGLESHKSLEIILKPKKNIGYATVILDIRNRSNIVIGTIELWRYKK